MTSDATDLYPSYRREREARLAAEAEIERLRREVGRLRAELNNPETADFLAGVMREAPHARARWSADDARKTGWDWVRLIGWLATKAAVALAAGDREKAAHNAISAAAALANWHAAIRAAS